MKNKIAVFVDFENLRQNVFLNASDKLKLFFDYNRYPNKIVEFCNALLDNNTEEVYRIFFYIARPDKTHPQYDKINNMFNALEECDHVALRQGKIVKRGETYVQKQVDMLLGLDIAEISIKKYANKILLLGYDSDMSPALKLARINGMQSEIVNFTDLRINIEHTLKKHCDIVRKFKVSDVYKAIGLHNVSSALPSGS